MKVINKFAVAGAIYRRWRKRKGVICGWPQKQRSVKSWITVEMNDLFRGTFINKQRVC